MLFLVEPLTRSEQNTRRDHPITAPSHPATKAIATTEHNVLTHPLKTPHNYPPLTPPLSKGCRYGVLGDATARSRARAAGAARRIVLHDAERGHRHPMTTRGNPRENRHPLRLHRRATVGAASFAIAFVASTLARPSSASTVSVTVLASTVSIPATASIFFTRNAPALFIHLRDDVQQALCAITLRQWALTS